MFEPFVTTKKTGEGTGLGLSTAYGIVKQSGGYIFAKSAVGSGSVFTLYFPVHEDLTDDTPVPVAPPKPVAPQQHGFGVVLLVEDEAPVRAFAGTGWTREMRQSTCAPVQAIPVCARQISTG